MASARLEPVAFSDFGPTLAERLVRRIQPVLKHSETSEWDDWLYIIATIFVEAKTSERVLEIVSSGRAGLLGRDANGEFYPWAPQPTSEADLAGLSTGEYSYIELGDPPAAVPGLVDYLLVETFRQLRLRISEETDPLTRMGLSQIAAPEETIAFGILESGVLLQELHPGQTMIISGRSGAGKTTLAVQDLIAPALAKGLRVVSNIYLEGAPKGYTYVTSLSEYLVACLKNALEGATTIAVRDEGGLGRMKQAAMSERNRELKMLTMILRKLRTVEITIYQLDGDVPNELLGFCTHYIRAIARGSVFVRTPIRGLERRIISDIPDDRARAEMGRPVLSWRTEDVAALVHDIRIDHLLGILRGFARDLKRGKADPNAQFEAMLDYIQRVTGLKELQFTEDDVMKMIQEVHYNKPAWGWRRIDEVVQRAREAVNHGAYWTYTTAKALGIWEHKSLTPRALCDWCRQHRLDDGE